MKASKGYIQKRELKKGPSNEETNQIALTMFPKGL
jgi:hypothetical protein